MAERRIEPPQPVTERLHAEIAPHLAELGGFLRRLDGFAARLGLSTEDSYGLSIILDEIVTNIISYGLADSEAGPIVIDMKCRRRDMEMEIEISDPGPPFDPCTIPTPDLDQPLADRLPGGLGIHLVRAMTDSMTYRYQAGRNHLTLVKRLGKEG